jgi:hypothetical protein
MHRLGLLLVLAMSSVAAAQPRESAAPKSEITAQVLTGAGIALPGIAMLAGAHLADDLDSLEAVFVAGSVAYAVLPAAGQWYAGRLGAFGLGVRTAGAAAMIGGFHVIIASEARDDRGVWLLAAGASAVVAGQVYDFLTVPSSVRAWNREHAIQPSLIAVPGGHGFGLAGTF